MHVYLTPGLHMYYMYSKEYENRSFPSSNIAWIFSGGKILVCNFSTRKMFAATLIPHKFVGTKMQLLLYVCRKLNWIYGSFLLIPTPMIKFPPHAIKDTRNILIIKRRADQYFEQRIFKGNYEIFLNDIDKKPLEIWPFLLFSYIQNFVGICSTPPAHQY